MVRELFDPGVTTVGVKVTTAPGGGLSRIRETGSVNPMKEPTWTVVCTVPSLHSDTDTGFSANVKLGRPALIVMLALLISKKILFDPFTITLPVVVVPGGMATVAYPSFGSFSDKAIG